MAVIKCNIISLKNVKNYHIFNSVYHKKLQRSRKETHFFVNYFCFSQKQITDVVSKKTPNISLMILCGIYDAMIDPGIAPAQAQKERKRQTG